MSSERESEEWWQRKGLYDLSDNNVHGDDWKYGEYARDSGFWQQGNTTNGFIYRHPNAIGWGEPIPGIVAQGWQCPYCKVVYSPKVEECRCQASLGRQLGLNLTSE